MMLQQSSNSSPVITGKTKLNPSKKFLCDVLSRLPITCRASFTFLLFHTSIYRPEPPHLDILLQLQLYCDTRARREVDFSLQIA